MRPVVVRVVADKTEENRVGLAVCLGDGDFQELTTWDNMPIQDGSYLEMWAANWTECKTVYRWVGKWGRLSIINA